MKSRRLRDLVKRADPVLLPQFALRVRQYVDEGNWLDTFGPDVTLVPVPGRAPFVDGAFWGPRKIADALVSAGLAQTVWPTLVRTRAIKKSAFAAPGERPELDEQLESLDVSDLLAPTSSIVLVDDFVTKGRTLLAAATRLSGALPGCEVRAFAMVRTRGLVPEIDKIWDPVEGVIAAEHGDAERAP